MDQFTLVQFCPCGHTSNESIEKVRDQIQAIEAGTKLDAPILSSEDCPTCEDNYRRDEGLYDFFE